MGAAVLEAGPGTDAPAPGTVVTSVPALLHSTGVNPIFWSNTTVGGYSERMLLSAPLVLGCGSIGIAIIAALRHRGVEHVVASDFSPKRRQLAETMGATRHWMPRTVPFDTTTPALVFEAVGVPGLLNDIELAHPDAHCKIVVTP